MPGSVEGKGHEPYPDVTAQGASSSAETVASPAPPSLTPASSEVGTTKPSANATAARSTPTGWPVSAPEEPASFLAAYECLPHAQWIGVAQDESGATIQVRVSGQCLRFWAPSICLPDQLGHGESVSVLATPTGLSIKRLRP